MPFLERIVIVVGLCFAADLLLGLVFLAEAWHGTPSHLLHLEHEANIPTWYASAKWLVVSLLLGAFAAVKFERRQPGSWLLAALPLAFLFLSLDETAGVHEWIGYRSDVLLEGGTRENTPFAATGIWMFLLGTPLIGFFAFALSRLRPYFHPAGVLFKLGAGLAVFMTGAAGIEMLVNFVEHDSFAHYVQVFFEETFEMVGATAVLWGTLDLVTAPEAWKRLIPEAAPAA